MGKKEKDSGKCDFPKDIPKEFERVIRSLSYGRSLWQVWSDFLYVSAVSMANTFPTAEQEEREKEYLSTIGRYAKEEQELLAQLFAFVTLALEKNPEQDFLGSMYHRLNLQQEQKGQFFTPYHISHFMAEIQFAGDDDVEKMLDEKGYISVGDPACGAGAMLIAFANVARKHGINYQQNVLFEAQDIDRTAALMCYIQLSLLGCPAIVIIGDSLLKPGMHPDNDVWFTPFYYLNHWRFQDKSNKKADFNLKENPDGQLAFRLDEIA